MTGFGVTFQGGSVKSDAKLPQWAVSRNGTPLSTRGSGGRPSTRSPTMLRCTSSVPPRIDSDGAVSTDTVQVNVTNTNPQAIAGQDLTVKKKILVTLYGSASYDEDGDALAFAWTRLSGPNVILVGADTATPTFAPMLSAVYVFQLTVADGDGGISSDTVSVTATNSKPTSYAGADKMAAKRAAVPLDGTGSTDPDGDALAFVWTQISGTSVALTDQDTDTASFTPSEAGVYTFRLAVDDGDGGTDVDSVVVTVYGLPPTATISASQTTAETGATIGFDASTSTDPDGIVERFRFDFGDGTVINNTHATASHLYNDPGVYTVTVTVTDDDGNKTSAQVTIRVTTPARNGLADVWWMLELIVVLVAIIAFLLYERQKWRGRARQAQLEVSPPQEKKKDLNE